MKRFSSRRKQVVEVAEALDLPDVSQVPHILDPSPPWVYQDYQSTIGLPLASRGILLVMQTDLLT